MPLRIEYNAHDHMTYFLNDSPTDAFFAVPQLYEGIINIRAGQTHRLYGRANVTDVSANTQVIDTESLQAIPPAPPPIPRPSPLASDNLGVTPNVELNDRVSRAIQEARDAQAAATAVNLRHIATGQSVHDSYWPDPVEQPRPVRYRVGTSTPPPPSDSFRPYANVGSTEEPVQAYYDPAQWHRVELKSTKKYKFPETEEVNPNRSASRRSGFKKFSKKVDSK